MTPPPPPNNWAYLQIFNYSHRHFIVTMFKTGFCSSLGIYDNKISSTLFLFSFNKFSFHVYKKSTGNLVNFNVLHDVLFCELLSNHIYNVKSFYSIIAIIN